MEQKRLYGELTIKIVKFSAEDVICTSGGEDSFDGLISDGIWEQ